MQALKEFGQKQWHKIQYKTLLGLGIRSILLVVISLVYLIIILVAVVLDARAQEQQLQQNFTQAEAQIQTSQLVLRYLIDQETGVRGYLLTQESEFLDPYYVAKRNLPIALETLKRRSPSQERMLNDLKEKIDLRLQTMDEIFDVAKRLDLVATPWNFSNVKPLLSKSESENLLKKLRQSKVFMDSVREASTLFDDRQREIFSQQQTKIESRRRWIDRIQIIGVVISIILYLGIIALFRLLDRQLSQRDQERLYLTAALNEKVQELSNVNTSMGVINIALNHKKKSLENFIQAAAHDLKTPLRGIASLSQWIQEDLKNRDDSGDYFDLLNQRILRMQIIINELLKYTQIEAWMTQLQVVDINVLIQELRNEIPVPDNFELQILTSMPKVTTSYLGLKLVFEELIRNSIEHHDRRNGILTLESISYPDRVEFILRDNGPGIPLNYRAQVLEMFQVLDRLPSDNVGAGLALVSQAIELNGGELWLESVDLEGHPRGLQVRFTWLLANRPIQI
jgi:signal transduction histidine kinase/type II secretory pathway pseudopilin PulG